MSVPGVRPDERDPALARAWREASGDEPPADLDDAIRAAARRAVHAGPRPAERSFVQRWRVPLSVAALVVVSASLTLMISQRDAHLPTAVEPPPSGDAALARSAREATAADTTEPAAPAPGTAVRQPLSTQPPSTQPRTPVDASAGTRAQAQARKDEGVSAESREGVVVDTAPAAPSAAAEPAAKAAAPAAAGTDLRDEAAFREPSAPARPSEVESAEGVHKREAAPELDRMMRQSPASDAAEPPPGRARLKLQARPLASPPMREAEPLPEQWIEQIRELRRQGQVDEAEASLEQFRERYPDFPLPDDLATARER